VTLASGPRPRHHRRQTQCKGAIRSIDGGGPTELAGWDAHSFLNDFINARFAAPKPSSGCHEPLDKQSECAPLGPGEAARRVNRGQIGRRQGPILQNRHDLSGFQLGREIPLRRNRQPISQFTASRRPSVAITFNRSWRTTDTGLSKRPRTQFGWELMR
jgi:hypothetical protein